MTVFHRRDAEKCSCAFECQTEEVIERSTARNLRQEQRYEEAVAVGIIVAVSGV
jgi:hypothetical protein